MVDACALGSLNAANIAKLAIKLASRIVPTTLGLSNVKIRSLMFVFLLAFGATPVVQREPQMFPVTKHFKCLIAAQGDREKRNPARAFKKTLTCFGTPV